MLYTSGKGQGYGKAMGWRELGKAEEETRVNTNELWQREHEVWLKQHMAKRSGRLWDALLDQDRRERFKVVISMFGLLATVAAAIGLFLNYQDAIEDRAIARKQLALSEKRLFNDRFTKAVELLSHKDKSIRVASMLALEGISQESEKDHRRIMELLSSYVLHQSPSSSHINELAKISLDVQFALTVIGRRKPEYDLYLEGFGLTSPEQLSGVPEVWKIKLDHINLKGADLTSAKVNNALLYGSVLKDVDLSSASLKKARLIAILGQSANFSHADLRQADFRSSNLANAVFYTANLSGADLSEADFSGTDLTGANLKSADFKGANLDGTILDGSNLEAADLRDVKNLDSLQIMRAKNWHEAIYDSSLREQLGLPPLSREEPRQQERE